MDDLRLAVFGIGARSPLVDYAHEPGNGSRVVAACDLDQGKFSDARQRFGPDVLLTSDLTDLLDLRLDGAFVLTPDDSHEEIAVRLLDAGIATFLEKPMAITTVGCDRILNAARRSGAKLYIGHNMRHMPVVRTMRELILGGAVGEVRAIWCRHFVGHGGDFYFKDWHADRRRTNSLLLQKGAHDLDVMHWLAGGAARRVSAMGGLVVYGGITDRADRTGQTLRDWFDPATNWPPGRLTGLNPVIDVEDISMATMELDNGVFATYQQCHFTPDYWRNYTVIGTEGRLENFGDEEDAVVRVWNRRSGYRPDGDLTIHVPRADGTHGSADPAMVREFLGFVRHGGSTLTSPIAARDAVAACAAATLSLRSGGIPVDVQPVDPHLADHFGRPG